MITILVYSFCLLGPALVLKPLTQKYMSLMAYALGLSIFFIFHHYASGSVNTADTTLPYFLWRVSAVVVLACGLSQPFIETLYLWWNKACENSSWYHKFIGDLQTPQPIKLWPLATSGILGLLSAAIFSAGLSDIAANYLPLWLVENIYRDMSHEQVILSGNLLSFVGLLLLFSRFLVSHLDDSWLDVPENSLDFSKQS